VCTDSPVVMALVDVHAGDPWATGYRTRRPALLRSADGRVRHLDVHAWHRPATDDEHDLLDRARPPVLDVGCGPGRLLDALRRRGVPALGIDTSPTAVRRAAVTGTVLHRSVFDPLPLEGRWGSVLLLDGNVGIGGDPVALLRRVADLLAADGAALVEVGDPGRRLRRVTARVEDGLGHGPWFPWADVGVSAIPALAAAARLVVTERWRTGERWFSRLRAR
jgi:SAM-dependent methyltransferase